MSRIGNAPVIIPSGVTVAINDQSVSVTGPKGELAMGFRPEITIRVEEGKVLVSRKTDDGVARSLHGLYRANIANMVKGVTVGWTRDLELVGVGYRAQGGGNAITLTVGYSHPVKIDAPVGVNFTVAENTKVTVSGIDKILVGQIAANVRAVKPPEVYKGKGVRFAGEVVRRKAGKAGKAAGAK